MLRLSSYHVYVGDADLLNVVQFFVGAGKANQSALVYKFPPLTELGEKLLGAKKWDYGSQ